MLSSVLTPVVRTVLDAVKEGIVVLDASGDLVYANRSGRSVIAQFGAREHPRGEELRSLLVRRGARVAPLTSGDATLGETAYFLDADRDARTLAERERQAIVETLEMTGWRLTESAKRLGISRTTLWRRLRTYGLRRGGQRSWPGSS